MKGSSSGPSFALSRVRVLAQLLNVKPAAADNIMSRAETLLGPTRSVDAAQADKLTAQFPADTDEGLLLARMKSAMARLGDAPATSARHAGTNSLVGLLARAQQDVAASLPVDYAVVKSQDRLSRRGCAVLPVRRSTFVLRGQERAHRPPRSHERNRVFVVKRIDQYLQDDVLVARRSPRG